MRSVLMVCHGNICRSPMAATLMRVMAEAAGWDDALWVDSCGVSDEEEGNPMDRRAVAMLLSHGIRPAPHEARRFSRGDYAMYDDILCMRSATGGGCCGCWAATRRESCGCCWTTPMTPMI